MPCIVPRRIYSRLMLAKNHLTPPLLLDAISLCSEGYLLNNKNLNFNHHVQILRSICKNRNTKASTIKRIYEFANSSRFKILILDIASNKNTPLKILHELAENKNEIVRYEVCYNKKSDSKILDILSSDNEDSIRASVAINKKCTQKILKKLCSDPSHSVRYSVCVNPSTPIKIIKKLILDDVKYVSDAAKSHPSAKHFFPFD